MIDIFMYVYYVGFYIIASTNSSLCDYMTIIKFSSHLILYRLNWNLTLVATRCIIGVHYISNDHLVTIRMYFKVEINIRRTTIFH